MRFTGTTFLLFLSIQSLTSIVAFTLDPRRTKQQISTRDDRPLSSPLILHSNMAFDNFDMPDNFNNNNLMTDEIDEIDLLIRETDLAIEEVDDLIRKAESSDITTQFGVVKEGVTGFGLGLAISMALAVAMISPTATDKIKASTPYRTSTTSIVREQKRVVIPAKPAPVVEKPVVVEEVTPPPPVQTKPTTVAPRQDALVSPLARYMETLSPFTGEKTSSASLLSSIAPSLALTAAAAAFVATRPPPMTSGVTTTSDDATSTTTDASSSDITDAAATAVTPPPGVPLIYKWKHHPNGSISGFVQQSKLHEDGDYVITSPVGSGDVTENMVVTTASGSKYFLAGK